MKKTQWSFRRIEKKYLMDRSQYEALWEALADYVEPDDYPKSTICNIYYDTPDYYLIRRSLEKPLYKEKFRLRTYGTPSEDNPVFMEIKKKYKGVVYKRRIRVKAADAVEYMAGGPEPDNKDPQIMEEIHWFRNRYPLVPGMFIAYERIAFRAKDDPDLRITFDRNIRYRTEHMDMSHGDQGIRLLPQDKVLMEIKIPGAAPLWLSHILADLKIYPASFSKYGRAYMKLLEQNPHFASEVDHCA